MPRLPLQLDQDSPLGRAVTRALERDARATAAHPRPPPPPPQPPPPHPTPAAPRAHKFGAIATVVDGVRFASKGESQRYQDLRHLLAAGEIQDLRLQPRYPLVVNGQQVAVYVADFAYLEAGAEVAEDFKSPATSTDYYRLKARMFRAQYGQTIRETGKGSGFTPGRRSG